MPIVLFAEEKLCFFKNDKYRVKIDIPHIFRVRCAIVRTSTGSGRLPLRSKRKRGRKMMMKKTVLVLLVICMIAGMAAVLGHAKKKAQERQRTTKRRPYIRHAGRSRTIRPPRARIGAKRRSQ